MSAEHIVMFIAGVTIAWLWDRLRAAKRHAAAFEGALAQCQKARDTAYQHALDAIDTAQQWRGHCVHLEAALLAKRGQS